MHGLLSFESDKNAFVAIGTFVFSVPLAERSWSRLCNKKGHPDKVTEMQHPVSDRIMTMGIPLTKDRNATIASAYAPTMANPEDDKEKF